MSNLLQMGTDFEKKLKERAVSTENMLNSEFRKLEALVDRELNLNGQKIRAAISAHTAAVKEQLETLNSAVNAQFRPTENELARRQEELLWKLVKGRILYPSLTRFGPRAGFFCGYGGSFSGRKAGVAANILAIRDQEEALAKLRKKHGGVTYHEGRNGKFLVLPSGVKGENNWTVEKNAVRLVRE
nr:mobilization protein mobB - Escherichia coli plasmid ColK [Escherichia coli]